MSLARELLAKFGSLRGLLAAESKALKGEKGLGPAKAATLIAATEIVRRSLREEIIGKDAIRDPESILTYLSLSLRDRKKEVFKIIFLNKANRILDEIDLFEGTVDEAAVHPREVVKAALDRRATGSTLLHNYPLGPELTKKPAMSASEARAARTVTRINYILVKNSSDKITLSLGISRKNQA